MQAAARKSVGSTADQDKSYGLSAAQAFVFCFHNLHASVVLAFLGLIVSSVTSVPREDDARRWADHRPFSPRRLPGGECFVQKKKSLFLYDFMRFSDVFMVFFLFSLSL